MLLFQFECFVVNPSPSCPWDLPVRPRLPLVGPDQGPQPGPSSHLVDDLDEGDDEDEDHRGEFHQVAEHLGSRGVNVTLVIVQLSPNEPWQNINQRNISNILNIKNIKYFYR